MTKHLNDLKSKLEERPSTAAKSVFKYIMNTASDAKTCDTDESGEQPIVGSCAPFDIPPVSEPV